MTFNYPTIILDKESGIEARLKSLELLFYLNGIKNRDIKYAKNKKNR